MGSTERRLRGGMGWLCVLNAKELGGEERVSFMRYRALQSCKAVLELSDTVTEL